MNKLMTSIFDDFDNVFANIDALVNYDRKNALSTLNNIGLKRVIKRPHNLITVVDKDGKTTGFKLEVVYTPFAKEDVKVEILKNVLTVTCGNENKQKDENEQYNYCGVSYQTFCFSLPLDESVDIANINAKADDGMLRIHMPMKQEVLKNEEPLKITVQ